METLEVSARTLQYVLELIGVISFSISGAMAGIRNRLDWFGVIVLGFVVAVGGGTLRDMVLGERAWWLSQPWQVFLSLSAAGAMIIAARIRNEEVDTWRSFLLVDAAGLAVFAALGADTALRAGAPAWAAVALAVLTGTGGGVIRDVLVNRPPLLLTGQIYALAAAAGASVQVGLATAADVPVVVATWLGMATTLSLRTLVILRNWNLPIAAYGIE